MSQKLKQSKTSKALKDKSLVRAVMEINMKLLRPSLILSIATSDIVDIEGDIIREGEIYFNHKELLGEYQPLSRRTIDKVFADKVDNKLYTDDTKEELFGFIAALFTLQTH